MRHRLQHLDHRQVVGGMHDGAEPMRHDRQPRRRWLAVQFGKEAGHAPAHRMPREGRARCRMDVRQGRAGRPVRPRRRRLPVGSGMDQHRGRAQARCRQRRGMAGEFLLRVALRVAQRQQLQIIGRAGQRRLQRGKTGQVARDIARRIQMAQQALRPDRGQILRRAGQMRRIRPGQGQRRLRKARLCHPGLRAGDRGRGRAGSSRIVHGLGVSDRSDWYGQGLRQRAVVGLEGGITPLALILHLEDVAVKAAMDAPAPRLMGQAGDVHEGLPRRDQRRESARPCAAVRMVDRDRRPRDPGDRVQQREAGAVRPDLPGAAPDRPSARSSPSGVDRLSAQCRRPAARCPCRTAPIQVMRGRSWPVG